MFPIITKVQVALDNKYLRSETHVCVAKMEALKTLIDKTLSSKIKNFKILKMERRQVSLNLK